MVKGSESRSVVSDSLLPHGLYRRWNSLGQNRVNSFSLLQGIFPTQGSKPDLPHCRQILYQLSHRESPKMLQWVVSPFSHSLRPHGVHSAWNSPGENTGVASHSILQRIYSPWNSPGQNTGVGSLSLLQGIFPTQGSNLGLPRCRQILYQLSHKRSQRILEWVVYPFSRGSS